MNTTLTRTPRHSDQPAHAENVARTRRVGTLDRAALYLGMALIRWGRRPGRALARYERRATPHELALLRRERDAAMRELEHAKARAMQNLLARIR